MEKKKKNSAIIAPKSEKDVLEHLWDEQEPVKEHTFNNVGTYPYDFDYVDVNDIDKNTTYYYALTDTITTNREKYNLMESVFFTTSTEFKNFKRTLKKYEAGKNIFKMSRSVLKSNIFDFNCNIFKEKVKITLAKEHEKKMVKASKYKYDK